MPRMKHALEHPMVVVTGKGGVGKSTGAAALALAAARDGRRVAVGELGGHARVAGLLRGTGIDTLTVDVHHALTEWLATQLPRRLADLLMRSGAFASLVAAAPGGAELIAITKLWELVQRRRWSTAEPYDLVIVDAPASGHGAALLRAPRTFADIARVGPIGSQAREVADFLKRDAGFVIVTTPAELPVTETLQLQNQLPDVDLVIANAVLPRRFAPADVARLSATDGEPAAAARAHAGRVRAQQLQLARLRRGARGAVLTLPWLLDVEPEILADCVAR
jgi:anion-transporting  ArsA/GET3 family ATPase